MKKKNVFTKKRTGIVLVVLVSATMLGSVPVTNVNAYTWGFWQEISFNCLHPVLQNNLVRKALNNLVDKEWIIETMVDDPLYQDMTFVSGVTAWSPALPWYNTKLQPYYHSLDEQRILSSISGTITVIVPNTNPLRILWAQEVVAAWNEYAPIFELVLMGWGDISDPYGGIVPRTFGHAAFLDDDPSTTIPTFEEGGYDILFVGLSYGVDPNIDPIIDSSFEEFYITGGSGNFYQYSNLAFDNLVDTYIRVGGNRGLAYAIQTQFYQDPPVIILFQAYE